MSNTTAVIACEQLSKIYKEGKLCVDVLDNINLAVQAGEQVAIIGPSGAGKSTLLHLLGGLDKPTRGQVFAAGTEITQLTEKARCQLRNRHFGFIYQFHHLLPEFSALENVAMPLLIRSHSAAKARRMATDMLKKVGLGDRLTHKIGQLSGGERQRTAIARALVNQPKIIFADEPTGNLDHHTADQVFSVLLELNQTMEMSLLIVTHDLHLAAKMDRIWQLEDGGLQGVNQIEKEKLT